MAQKLIDWGSRIDTGEVLKYMQTFKYDQNNRALGWKLGEPPSQNAVSDCARLAASRDRRVFGVINGAECWVHWNIPDEEVVASVQAQGRHEWGTEMFDNRRLASGGRNQMALYVIPEEAMKSIQNRLPAFVYPRCLQENPSCVTGTQNLFQGMKYQMGEDSNASCFKAKNRAASALPGAKDMADGKPPPSWMDVTFESCEAGRDTRQPPPPLGLRFPDGKYVSYHGCYLDTPERRPFSAGTDNVGGPIQSVQQCAKLAARHGKRAFGVEAGNECWLADSATAAKVEGRLPYDKCNNSRDFQGYDMGGGWSAAIYEMDDDTINNYSRMETTDFGDIEFLGCWEDDRNNRIFTEAVNLSNFPIDSRIEIAMRFAKQMDYWVFGKLGYDLGNYPVKKPYPKKINRRLWVPIFLVYRQETNSGFTGAV